MMLSEGNLMFNALMVVMVVLQLLDWYSTRTILASDGREETRLDRKLMARMGVDGFLAVKTIAAIAACYWIGLHVVEVLAVLVGYYIAIIQHNWQSLP